VGRKTYLPAYLPKVPYGRAPLRLSLKLFSSGFWLSEVTINQRVFLLRNPFLAAASEEVGW